MFACPFCQHIKLQTVLLFLRQHARAHHAYETEQVTGNSFRDMAVRAAQDLEPSRDTKENTVHNGTTAPSPTCNGDNDKNMKVNTEVPCSSSADNDSESSQFQVPGTNPIQVGNEGAAHRARVRRVILSLREELSETARAAIEEIKNSAYERASSAATNTEVFLTLGGVPLDCRDVFSMAEGHWVTDNVINAFIPAVISRLPGTRNKIHCISTHLSTLTDLSRTKTWRKGIKLNQKSLIIIPYHHGGCGGGLHWSVVLMFVRKGELLHLDPISPQREGVSNNSRKVARSLYAACRASPHSKDREMAGKWKAICRRKYGQSHSLPPQPNGDDCGVYACIYAVHAAISIILDGVGVKDICPGRRPEFFRRAIRMELLRRHHDVPRTQRLRSEDATPIKK